MAKWLVVNEEKGISKVFANLGEAISYFESLAGEQELDYENALKTPPHVISVEDKEGGEISLIEIQE